MASINTREMRIELTEVGTYAVEVHVIKRYVTDDGEGNYTASLVEDKTYICNKNQMRVAKDDNEETVSIYSQEFLIASAVHSLNTTDDDVSVNWRAAYDYFAGFIPTVAQVITNGVWQKISIGPAQFAAGTFTQGKLLVKEMAEREVLEGYALVVEEYDDSNQTDQNTVACLMADIFGDVQMTTNLPWGNGTSAQPTYAAQETSFISSMPLAPGDLSAWSVNLYIDNTNVAFVSQITAGRFSVYLKTSILD